MERREGRGGEKEGRGEWSERRRRREWKRVMASEVEEGANQRQRKREVALYKTTEA